MGAPIIFYFGTLIDDKLIPKNLRFYEAFEIPRPLTVKEVIGKFFHL
jgi:hypothetical protein